MKINCIGARAVVTELDLMASGAANYYTATFTFDSAWDTYTYRWAVFKGSRVTEMVALENNSCHVPSRVLANATELFVGAVGANTLDINDAGTLLTTNMTFVCKVPEGAATSATIANQDPTLIQQLIQAVFFSEANQVWEDYNPATAYFIGNKVVYLGNSYYCKADTTAGTLPTDTDYWILIAGGGLTTSLLTGYEKATTFTPVLATDNAIEGIEKVEGQVENSASNVLLKDYNKESDFIEITSSDTIKQGIEKVEGQIDYKFTVTDTLLGETHKWRLHVENEIPSIILGESDTMVGVEVDFENSIFTRLAGAIGKAAGTDFNGINAFGGRRRCNLADNGTVNAYYGDAGYIEDGSNGQVMVEQPKFYYSMIPLEKELIKDYPEEDVLTISAAATSSGNITIVLNGVSFTVAVVSGDTTTAIGGKIRAASFSGWVVTGSGASATFTATDSLAKSAPSFSGGTTGVTGSFSRAILGGIPSSGYHVKKAQYYISDTMQAGFRVHPAFIRNGIEKDKIYIRAYEGSIYDVSTSTYILDDAQIADFTVGTGDKICSIANAKPASGLTQNLTRANSRILANNRGTGWQLEDVLTASLTQMLFVIEYASFNTQTALGLGVVNKASGTGNEAELTGATALLGNNSGIAAGTNGLVSISYRGQENFWGNIWKWQDGLNIELEGIHNIWFADNNFVDNIKTTPYISAGWTLSKKNGYVSRIGWSPTCNFLFLPSMVTGSSSLPVGDYFYQTNSSSGWRVSMLGGHWYYGLGAGAFCWYVNNSSSHRNRSIGCGAVFIP